MIKRSFVLVGVFLPFAHFMIFSGCSTPREKLEDSLFSREESFTIQGKSADELYVAANLWMVENFNSAESVIEFSDKESGVISGKYVFQYGQSLVKSVIHIRVESEKCRVSFRSPSIKNMGKDMDYRGPTSNKSLQIIQEEWEKLSDSLNLYLKSSDK